MAALDEAWQGWRREVRRLHEKLFYRPLLTAVAKMPGSMTGSMTGSTTGRDGLSRRRRPGPRMAALGFADPKAALRHLEALTSGVTRTATSRRRSCRRCSAGSPTRRTRRRAVRLPTAQRVAGSTPWYLSTLRDEGHVAERLARVLATSAVRDHAHRARAAGRPDARGGPHARRRRAADSGDGRVGRASGRPGRGGASIRAIRRRELLRLAAGDLFGEVDVADVGAGLSRLTDATLEATLEAAGRAVREQQGLAEAPTVHGRGRDGPLRRLRAVLRQRRRRDVRARAAPRRRPARRRDVRADRGQRATTAAGPADDRPGAGGRRRPAPRGQAGPAGPHPRLLRRVLREVVAGLGVPGPAARRCRGRRRGPARAVHRADRPAPLPGGRASPTPTWRRYGA